MGRRFATGELIGGVFVEAGPALSEAEWVCELRGGNKRPQGARTAGAIELCETLCELNGGESSASPSYRRRRAPPSVVVAKLRASGWQIEAASIDAEAGNRPATEPRTLVREMWENH
jgi:hypothetical protein